MPSPATARLGAQSTVLVLLLAGQGAFAASFQMGGDFFTRAIARLRHCPEETAESLKRTRNLLSGPDASPEFIEVIDGWIAELKRQLNEWLEHNPALASKASSFELVASGGGFDQPGLRDHVKLKAGLDFRPWPKPAQPNVPSPAQGLEIAFGTWREKTKEGIRNDMMGAKTTFFGDQVRISRGGVLAFHRNADYPMGCVAVFSATISFNFKKTRLPHRKKSTYGSRNDNHSFWMSVLVSQGKIPFLVDCERPDVEFTVSFTGQKTSLRVE